MSLIERSRNRMRESLRFLDLVEQQMLADRTRAEEALESLEQGRTPRFWDWLSNGYPDKAVDELEEEQKLRLRIQAIDLAMQDMPRRRANAPGLAEARALERALRHLELQKNKMREMAHDPAFVEAYAREALPCAQQLEAQDDLCGFLDEIGHADVSEALGVVRCPV